MKSIFKPSADPIQSWILTGIPVLFLIGWVMHYVYEWSGNLILVGIFAPINESIWEHLKLTFWPMLIWWFAGYLIYRKSSSTPNTALWFSSCALAMLVCPLVIMSFFYTYTGALGLESLILDIFSLLLGLTVAQTFSLHIYRHASFNRYWLIVAAAILVLLAAAFTIFTFDPFYIPVFKDSLTGKYGI
jgi:hypothetical protein